MRRIRQSHPRYRQRLAHEAARLMAEGGLNDYGQAKRKAARRFGMVDEAMLPRNDEVQAALREYQRLFQSRTQPLALRQRREAALRALDFFAGFSPRLVGPVLDGSADVHSPIVLHVHADDADEIARFLAESGIPATARSAGIRLDRQRSLDVPEWHFMAGDLAFELQVLPFNALHQAPLSALDDRPGTRATAAQVRRLLDGWRVG